MKFIIAFLLLFSLDEDVFAQPNHSSVTGIVVDGHTNEPILHAVVKLEADSSLHIPRRGGYTDSNGSFSIGDLDPTAYRITISMVTYAPFVLDTVVLSGESVNLGTILLNGVTETEDVLVTSDRYFTVIEDACCNIEAMNKEFTDLAPFSPSPTQILRRYSSCTSSRIICSIDNSSTVRLRGLEGSRIRMHIDGLPLFGSLSSLYALQQIPSSAIANLRIYEGVSSAQYGSGAISGVVDFETKPPAEPNQFDFLTNVANGFEEFGMPQRDVSVSYVGSIAEDVGVAGFLSYNGKAIERSSNSLFSSTPGYDRLSALAKSRFGISNSVRLTVAVLGAAENRIGGEQSPGYSEDIKTSRVDAYSKFDANLSATTNLFGAISFSRATQQSLYGDVPFNASQDISYAQMYLTGIYGDHGLKYGVEARAESLNEESQLGVGYVIKSFGAFAEDEFSFAENWSLLGGLRYDHHSYAGNLISPRFSLSYQLFSNLKMRVSTGQGFKAQALFDDEHLILHGIYKYRNNTSLGYEKSWTYNYDLSWDYQFGDMAGTINAIAYYTAISDRAMPQTDSISQGVVYFINSKNSGRLVGFEFQTRPIFDDYWSGALGIGVVRYEHQNEVGIYERLPLSPTFTVDLSLMYANIETGWTVESWSSIIGTQRLPTDIFSLEEAPSYMLINLRLSKQVGKVTFHAGLLNILDERQDAHTPTAVTLSNGKVHSTSVWGSLEGREIFCGVRLTL